MHEEKKFIRNFKDVDDNNIAGHSAIVDEAYQQFLDFQEQQKKRDEEEKEMKRLNGGLAALIGKKRNPQRVFDEYNGRSNPADVLGGQDGDDELPAHEILPSHGRQSSFSSHYNNQGLDYDDKDQRRSAEITAGQLGHQNGRALRDDEMEMSDLQNSNRAGINIIEPRVNQIELSNPGNANLSQNSIEDIMENQPDSNATPTAPEAAGHSLKGAPLSTNLTPLPPPSRSSHIQIEDQLQPADAPANRLSKPPAPNDEGNTEYETKKAQGIWNVAEEQ